ncbi:MAG: DUF1080 domain-containing protein [Gemmataceae bacterium]
MRFLALTLISIGVGATPAGDLGTGARDLLKDGLDAWQSTSGKAPKGWTLEDGALSLGKGGGYLWTKERFDDFVLDLEVNTTGNSGVFIRTDKMSDPVQTGIEIQVDNPSAKPGKHSFGAFYDLVAPTKCPAKKGEWTRLVITARGPLLKVEMNGEAINEMNLDKWTEPGKNPDGTKNKYTTALKDFKREGHIGFQDHGAAVKYRNIKIRQLR